MKKIIIFDLDGTLAESKTPLTPPMSGLLSKLLAKVKVAVVSGASFKQFEKQFLAYLPSDPKLLQNLYLFPVNGSSFYAYEEHWKQMYAENLSSEDERKIKEVFTQAIQQSGIDIPKKTYGEILEQREGSQITFSALGQEAPIELKKVWDPNQEKRLKVISILERLLPDFEARTGGMTSIDVTRKGIDKKYAVGKIVEYLKIDKGDMIYVGDQLFPGGNDYGAIEAGIETERVNNPGETEIFIKKILDSDQGK